MEPATPNTMRRIAFALVLWIAAILLFLGLGKYSLWDDEAAQAMFAESTWQTGDTSAMIGRNIVAYDYGAELKNLHDRATPPLTSYLMAPFVGASTISTLRPRLPLALCGVAFCALFLLWVDSSGVDGPTAALLCMGLLGNVSLFLFFRQARYYGITLLFSLALAFLYLRWRGSRRALLALSLLMAALFATHTIIYAAVAATLLIDYAFWGQRKRRLTAREWAVVLAPQMVLGGALLLVWNPFETVRGGDLFADTVRDRLRMFWWNLRDLNNAELGCGLLLLAAPFLWRRRADRAVFLRGPVAIVTYCAAVAIVSPKVVAIAPPFADVRYLLPLVPLCIVLAALTLRTLAGKTPQLALALGLAAFGTNLLNGGPLLSQGLRSTIASYLSELRNPVPGPYEATVRWIDDHVQPGESIWVLPGYATFPLMYHAPKAIYAWQLRYPPEPQFKGLLAIHFLGLEPPDYMIAFGPYIGGVERVIESGRNLGYAYQKVATIDEYWVSEHLPSLIMHKFSDRKHFDPSFEAIYIFKRVPAEPAHAASRAGR